MKIYLQNLEKTEIAVFDNENQIGTLRKLTRALNLLH
jgi:hypothetical protein